MCRGDVGQRREYGSRKPLRFLSVNDIGSKTPKLSLDRSVDYWPPLIA
jgi:hypothetical protein